MKTISVIVPVYNVEKYLGACIDSILAQTFTDYEIILVDDGSKDNSGAICDTYAEKYEQIQVIHKENGGLSDARNYGMRAAEGEYLLFIDSDDFYDDNHFFQKIADAVQKEPEVIVFHFGRKIYAEGAGIIGTNIEQISAHCINEKRMGEKLLRDLVATDSLMISACFKVLKRTYLLDNELFFKKGIKGEDIEWSMRLFADEIPMQFMQHDPYVYRAGREGSITSTMNTSNLDDLYTIISEYADKFVASNNNMHKALLHYLAYQFSIYCGLIVRIPDKKTRKDLIKKAEKYAWLLQYDLSPKVKKVAKLARYAGLTNTIRILGFYIKHRG